jgi:hypothetical protein
VRISEEEELIKQIAARTKAPLIYSTILWELQMVHFEICPLRLGDLLTASEEEFNKELNGIHINVDLLDGSFREGFKPRFAK